MANQSSGPLLPKFNDKWVKKRDGFNKETIDFAEKLGKYLAKNGLTSTQIRNVYEEVKRIEARIKNRLKPEEENSDQADLAFLEVRRDFLLLRPKIAYAAKRAGNKGILDFKNIMDEAHTAVLEGDNSIESFINFSQLFEAILAYHKVYGGRD